jgi:hypothetical protein
MLDVSIDPDFLPEPVFVGDPLGDPLYPLDPEIPGRELFDLGTRLSPVRVSEQPSGVHLPPELTRLR